MGKEASGEEIHIFSSGRSMVETFKSAVNKYSIDRIVVFVEASDDAKSRKEIDNAVDELRKLCGEIGIKFDTVKIGENSMDDVRDSVIKLTRETDCKLSFNLTGGRKILALYLFTMALWVNGNPYYVDISGRIVELSIPRIHADELTGNPNLVRILSIVNSEQERYGVPVKNSDVFQIAAADYRPNRKLQEGGNSRLQRGTFSKWVRLLIGRKLLEEHYVEDNHKSKTLSITQDGIFAVKFFSNPQLSGETNSRTH